MVRLVKSVLLALVLVTSPGLVIVAGGGPATASPGATASPSPAASGTDRTPRSMPAASNAPSARPQAGPDTAPRSAAKTKAPALTLTVDTTSPTTYGDTVHLVATADLSKLAGGGTMAFTDGKAVIGFGPVDGTGTAEMATTRLPAGKHSLTASYTVTGKTTSVTASLTVGKRVLNVYAKPSSWSRPVGAPNPTFTPAVVPGNEGDLVNGDTVATAVTGKPKYTLSAGPKSPPSLYPVSLSGLSSTNYALAFQKWDLVVYSRDIGKGSTAPELTGRDQNGDNFSLSSLRGQAVLLDFSAVWCGPSNLLAHDIPKIAADLQSRGISFVYVPVLIDGPSVGVPSTQANARNYVSKYKLPGQTHVLHMGGAAATEGSPLPMLVDQHFGYGAVPAVGALGGTAAASGGVAYPTLAFIDPDGVIKDVVVGYQGVGAVEDSVTGIAPDTGVQVTAEPSSLTTRHDATIEFTTTGDAQAQCSIDGGALEDCDSPLELTGLADGDHTVEITIGWPYSTHLAWTISTIDTTITGGPGDTYVPTFEFTGTAAATRFLCWSDDEEPYECESPSGVYQMPGGLHTFHVAAVDADGFVDDSPATMEFTTQPLPTFDLQPDIANPGPDDHVTWTARLTDAETGLPVTGSVVFSGPDGRSDEIALDSDGSASWTESFAGGGYTEYVSYLGDPDHGVGYAEASVP